MYNENGTKGYLYSIKTGELIVREGYIKPWGHNGYSGMCYFDKDDKRNHCRCDIKPETVLHDILWLTERDDNYAIELFLRKEYDRFHGLLEEVHRIEEKIAGIKKMKSESD